MPTHALATRFEAVVRDFVEREQGLERRIELIPAGSEGAILCQVCGMSEPGAWVRCARCDTPHHPDCWDHAGRCSTYGCGSRRACLIVCRTLD